MSDLDKLDADVAREVMGLIYQKSLNIFPATWIGDDAEILESRWKPTNDVAQAIYDVVPVVVNLGGMIEMYHQMDKRWMVRILHKPRPLSLDIYKHASPSLPEAICRAALEFVRARKEKDNG